MDNKSKIEECALEMFWARGYDAVGVQEIVEAAGVTKPTLYHYFGNKEGLLNEIIRNRYSNLFDMINQSAAYKGDLPLTMYKLTSSYFSYAKVNSKFYGLIMSFMFYPYESEPYKAVKPLIDKEISMLEDLFLQASKDHGNMKNRHKIYAATYFGMINTYIKLYFDSKIELNEEDTFKAIHQFMHGIYS